MLLKPSKFRFLLSTVKSKQYSTTSTAVKLSFDKFSIKASNEPPVLICHGLFGSKQNWSSLAKVMSNRLSRDVYTIDLRNHGDSPHTKPHTYEAMTKDLVQFISDQKDITSPPILVGHSMGGKAVMSTALTHPDIISKLIVVDMPPVAMHLSRSFATYVDAMREIEMANPTKHSEADKILAKFESNVGVRMFLLTNLKRNEKNELRFRVPYELLGQSLETIGGFEAATSGSKAFDKDTLFIAGGKSPYLEPFKTQEKEIKALFPNSELQVIEGAGHWVHAEKPDATLNLITDFINKK